MAQIISDNILADLPKVFDDKTGVFQAGVWRPYNTVGEFQARFPNVGVAETQMFWVRNPDDANKADLYALRKNKTPYKILDDIDLSNYYTQGEIDTTVNNLQDLITTAQSTANTANANATEALSQILDVNEWLTDEIARATTAEGLLQSKTDNALNTTSKQVVPAINELKSRIDDVEGVTELGYSDLQADHKTYINSDLSGKTYYVFQNGISRFLMSSEININPAGGFTLINELSNGDTLFLIGETSSLNGLNVRSFATFTALQAANPRLNGIYRAIADDSENGDGSESFFLSFENRLFYQVLIEQ